MSDRLKLEVSSASAVTFRPARRTDQSFLVDVLAATFEATPRSHWNALFDYPWLAEEDKPDFGTVAELDGRIIGFLGAIYADREWSSGPSRTCHMIGWWVDPERRGLGLGTTLVDAYLAARRDMPILMLTLRPDQMSFWLRHGAVHFDDRRRVLFRPLWTVRNQARVRWLSPDEVSRPGVLSDRDLRIWRDHRSLMCRPWVFRTDDHDEACLLVSRRRTVEASGVPGYRELMGRFGCLKPGSNRSGLQLQLDRLRDLLAGKIPCAEILYASHPERLQAAFGTVARRLCSEHRAIGLVADERRLGLPPDPTRHNAGHYYCIPNGGPVDEFDALYAEFLLMRM